MTLEELSSLLVKLGLVYEWVDLTTIAIRTSKTRRIICGVSYAQGLRESTILIQELVLDEREVEYWENTARHPCSMARALCQELTQSYHLYYQQRRVDKISEWDWHIAI